MVRGIALSGQFGAGKSAVATALDALLSRRVSVTGMYPIRVSFAKPLKTLTKAILVEQGLVQPSATEAEWKPEHGGLLQLIGAHLRGYDEDVWVKIALAQVKRSHGFILIDDARFPNEIDALKAHDIKVVRLHASRKLRMSRITTQRDERHISETALDHYEDWDLEIHQPDVGAGTPEAYALSILQHFMPETVWQPKQATLGA